MINAYDAFASAYDVLNTEIDYDEMAEYIKRVLTDNGVEQNALVLDLGCGTGRLTSALSSLGYDMTGVDSSEEMLSRAIEGSDGDILYLCQDITDFELYGTVAAAVCTTDTVNHLTEVSQLERTVSLLHNYIEPGGIFIFDVNSPAKFEKVYGKNDYVLEDEGVVLTWQNDYDPDSRIADFYITLFEEREDGAWNRSDTDFSERCYSLDELCRILSEGGFEVLSVTDSYSDRRVDEETQRIVVAARRI